MSDTLIAALIALVGAVILVPVATRIIGRRFEKQFSLEVSIVVDRFKVPPPIEGIIKEEVKRRDWKDPSIKIFEETRIFQCWGQITIKNVSKKKVGNVSIIPSSYTHLHYIVDNNSELSKCDGRPIVAGDIQPDHERVVTFWSGYNFGVSWPVDLEKAFKISADEIDRVKYVFPIPDYLKPRFTFFPPWVGFYWKFTTLVLSVLIGPMIVASLFYVIATHFKQQ